VGAYVGQNVSAATEQTSATAQEAAAAAQEPAHAAEGLQQVIARFRVSADA
jgi:methyl-accepting chemotaxis protein